MIDPGPDDAGTPRRHRRLRRRPHPLDPRHPHPPRPRAGRGRAEGAHRRRGAGLRRRARRLRARRRPSATGAQLEATEFRLPAVHTPGHASNHLCYLLESERLLFSGDHIMRARPWSSPRPTATWPPTSGPLRRLPELRRAPASRPGTARSSRTPTAKVDEYLAHRQRARGAILTPLAGRRRRATVDEIVAAVYADVARASCTPSPASPCGPTCASWPTRAGPRRPTSTT